MASKKKVPSFEIPEAVRDAAQSGWVYRTGEERTKPRLDRRTHRAKPVETGQPPATVEGAPTLVGEALAPPPLPPAAEPAAATPQGPGMTGGIIGLGLQVAAVPLVVPLFLTAAVSRRLGITSEP